MRGRRRLLVLATVAAGGLVLAGVAAGAISVLEPKGPPAGAPGPACSPGPCTAPQGFELYLSQIQLRSDLDGDLVTVMVSFRNNTQPQLLEAVSYRHTSPADFQVTPDGGNQGRPVFTAGCPDWPEIRVPRGSSAGPQPLCFRATAARLKGAVLSWQPDLGLFSVAGSVPLA